MDSNVRWILNCSVDDINFKCTLKNLTEEQIRYCLEREKRKSALAALKREARRKGIDLDLPASLRCPQCGWESRPMKGWKAMVCPRCTKWIQV